MVSILVVSSSRCRRGGFSRGCFPSVSRFFAGVLSFVVRGHGVVRSARRSFVRSSSSSSSSSSRSLKQCKCDEKIELDCDREKQKKKGKERDNTKASVFWVGALCVSKFEISHFLTHKSRWIEFLLFFVHGTDPTLPPPKKNFAKKKKKRKKIREEEEETKQKGCADDLCVSFSSSRTSRSSPSPPRGEQNARSRLRK